MNCYYYALWIPQYKEGIPDVMKTKLDQVDLRDRHEDPPLLVSGEINEKTFLISLRYTIGDASPRTLLFHWINQPSDKGFVVYKLTLDDDEDDFLCQVLRQSMPKAIYHYIKGFFHEHQFHLSEDDSLLDSYFSQSEIILSDIETQKAILKVYIQSYINKYAGCILLCRDTLHRVSRNLQQDIKLGDSQHELRQIIENNQAILDGESLYCDFLINSFPGRIDSEQLQRIYALRNELSRYDERLQRLEASFSSDYSIKVGKIGVVSSVIGAFVGVFFSLLLSKCSSDELQSGISIIRDEIKDIQTHDSIETYKLQEIQERQDSLLKLLNKTINK